MNENISINEKLNLEDELKKRDSVIWKCKGVSMCPFINGDKDLVVLEKIKQVPEPYDVVMYIRNSDYDENHKYVLHRFMHKEGNTYVILGDNCVTLEYVPEEKVIAVMKDLIKDGVKIDLNSTNYKLYKQLWIKPWKARVLLIRIKNKIKKILHIGINQNDE